MLLKVVFLFILFHFFFFGCHSELWMLENKMRWNQMKKKKKVKPLFSPIKDFCENKMENCIIMRFCVCVCERLLMFFLVLFVCSDMDTFLQHNRKLLYFTWHDQIGTFSTINMSIFDNFINFSFAFLCLYADSIYFCVCVHFSILFELVMVEKKNQTFYCKQV